MISSIENLPVEPKRKVSTLSRLQGSNDIRSHPDGNGHRPVESIDTARVSPETIRVIPPDTSRTLFLAHALEKAKKKDSQLKFIPYKHPTPGETKVHIKGRGDGEDAYVTVKYDPKKIPDPKIIPRDKIKLKDISPKLLKHATLVAKEIRHEWETANELKALYRKTNREYKDLLKTLVMKNIGTRGGSSKTRYISTPEKERLKKSLEFLKRKSDEHPFTVLYSKSTTVHYDSFHKVFADKVGALAEKGEIDREFVDDSTFEALVAYLCLRKNKKKGFLALPHGLLDASDKDLVKKIEMIGRYFVVHKLDFDTAKKIEDCTNWTRAYNENCLSGFLRLISTPNLLRLLSPGYLDGGNPPIREWLFRFQISGREMMKIIFFQMQSEPVKAL